MKKILVSMKIKGDKTQDKVPLEGSSAQANSNSAASINAEIVKSTPEIYKKAHSIAASDRPIENHRETKGADPKAQEAEVVETVRPRGWRLTGFLKLK